MSFGNEENLISIYEDASKYFYKNSENKIQKSKHWKRYDQKKFTLQNLINFRKDSRLSVFLDDQKDNFHFKIYSKIVNDLSEEYLLKNLPQKNIGNSNVLIPYKNVLVDYNKLIHIYWFWILDNKILKHKNIKCICEIGGGFGSFAELFIKNYDAKIFLIDLPEANLMSTYYLKELHPNKNFYLFSDYEKNKFYLSKSDFDKNDIIILPPNCNIDSQIKIDLFINTRSMMEMNFEAIKSYFELIQKYLKEGGYFLNINRYEKTSVGHPIRIAEYPYDNNWKVVISQPSFNQEWIHFLLTERNFNKDESDILSELKKIKEIGKKFHGLYKDPNPNSIITKFFKFSKKALILIFGYKFLNLIGNFLYKFSIKLKNVS